MYKWQTRSNDLGEIFFANLKIILSKKSAIPDLGTSFLFTSFKSLLPSTSNDELIIYGNCHQFPSYKCLNSALNSLTSFHVMFDISSITVIYNIGLNIPSCGTHLYVLIDFVLPVLVLTMLLVTCSVFPNCLSSSFLFPNYILPFPVIILSVSYLVILCWISTPRYFGLLWILPDFCKVRSISYLNLASNIVSYTFPITARNEIPEWRRKLKYCKLC